MFKNENGFSLVELAIAAGLAVALAATAVTILSGTTATLSSNANGAAGTSTTYNSDVLANASGAAGSGSQTPATPSNVFAAGTAYDNGRFTWVGSPSAPMPVIYLSNIVGSPDFGLVDGNTVTIQTEFGTVTGTINGQHDSPDTGGTGGHELWIYLTNVSSTDYGQLVSFTVN